MTCGIRLIPPSPELFQRLHPQPQDLKPLPPHPTAPQRRRSRHFLGDLHGQRRQPIVRCCKFIAPCMQNSCCSSALFHEKYVTSDTATHTRSIIRSLSATLSTSKCRPSNGGTVHSPPAPSLPLPRLTPPPPPPPPLPPPPPQSRPRLSSRLLQPLCSLLVAFTARFITGSRCRRLENRWHRPLHSRTRHSQGVRRQVWRHKVPVSNLRDFLMLPRMFITYRDYADAE